MLSACIGTDYVDVPLAPAPDRADILTDDLSLQVGARFQLDFRLLDADGREKPANWSWSSRDRNVAEVDARGEITALSPGQTWVDGRTAAGPADSVLVTVVSDPNAAASLIVSGTTNTLAPGDTLNLSAELRNANGDVLGNQAFSWISDNPAVATVSDQGQVVAITEGMANITARAAGINSLPFAISVQTPSMMRMGTFSGRNGYSAQGKVSLNVGAAGATVDFDTNFSTQNGPGLYVFLSPNATSVAGGVNLGKLESTSGMQSYVVSTSADLSTFGHVIIYCQPFGVPFGSAPLQ